MYLRPRLIPCLLITGMRDLVKTIKFKNPRYLGDPINAVKIFNEKGVDELCILDITASSEKRGPQMDYIRDVASEAFMPLSYGGGITSLEEIQQIFHMGYEKVVLNTAFYREPGLITKAAHYAGSQSIVVSIDVKTELLGKKNCYICDGKEKTGKDPVMLAKQAEALGAGEILLNSISRDGTMQGYDLELVKSVAEAVSIPVIACGGAGEVLDFKKVLSEGKAHAAAAGSLFVYYGEENAVLINFPEESILINSGIFENNI
jgi:cyclase